MICDLVLCFKKSFLLHNSHENGMSGKKEL